MEWLNHQLKLSLTKLESQEASWEALSRCNEVVEKVQRHFDEVFEDSEADFFELRTALNGLCQSAAVESTETPQDNHASNIDPSYEVAKTPTPVETAPAVKVHEPERRQSLDIDTDFSSPTASKRSLKRVAETILSAEPDLALSYRIHRHLTWCDINELPDSNNHQTPLILAVSQDKQAEYKDKAKQESDLDTIKRLERTLTDAPFWLTGHYYVYQMLKNLNLDDAAQAVCDEVDAFAKTLPGIELLSFKDSIPFANEATRNGLLKRVNHRLLPTSRGYRVWWCSRKIWFQWKMLLSKTWGEHVAEVAQKLELDSSGRGQFMLHLQIVKAYHAVELYPLCLPYLEKLWSIRDEMSLTSWEPHLSLQLDDLTQHILMQLYPNRDLLPAKFEAWESIYN
ncbi:type VI secretion system domain-containing protein [Vibrio ostreicida]|uniref:Type VI secretion system domain-containing protein n=1 Tax=Vibrio ostreicida TaxID=526588 RepID=A0ABT8BW17_9VIBR|nr:type VI secretion system domain-containing protein [Vibrio ostreicida]MDN3611206.1 type VI secretion system domain-containing protein [Vibrio ostreicida]